MEAGARHSLALPWIAYKPTRAIGISTEQNGMIYQACHDKAKHFEKSQTLVANPDLTSHIFEPSNTLHTQFTPRAHGKCLTCVA